VHREFAQVAIWEDGLVRQAGQIATTPEALRLFADSLAAGDEVALEATGNTHAIVRLLEGRVARVVVSNPQKTRAIAEAKVKTDRVDADPRVDVDDRLRAALDDAISDADEECEAAELAFYRAEGDAEAVARLECAKLERSMILADAFAPPPD